MDRPVSLGRRAAGAAVSAAVLATLLGACGSPEGGNPTAAPCRPSEPTCVVVGIGEPIFLGALLSKTEASGPDVRAGMGLAIDYLDGQFDQQAGSLAGHPVVVVDQSEDCSAESGRAGAKRLLAERRVIGAIGTTCSSSALGAADIEFTKRRVPLLSASNTAPALTDPANHQRYYFRMTFNDRIQSAVDAEFALSRGWTKVVAVSEETNGYSVQLAKAFASAVRRKGGEVAQFSIESAADIPSVAARAAAVGASAAFVPMFDPLCAATIAGLRSADGMADLPVIGSDACLVPETLVTLGDRATRLFASGPDLSALEVNPFYASVFLDGYRRLVGADPKSAFHPAAFDATNILMAAIRRAAVVLPGGAVAIDRERVREVILRIAEYPGISGTITCDASGECVPRARIGVYEAPGWPVGGRRPALVFSAERTLAELANEG